MEIKTTLFEFVVRESELDWLTEDDLISWFRRVHAEFMNLTAVGNPVGDIMGIRPTSEEGIVKRFIVHVALPQGKVGKRMRDQLRSVSDIAPVDIKVWESVVSLDEFSERYNVDLDKSRLIEA